MRTTKKKRKVVKKVKPKAKSNAASKRTTKLPVRKPSEVLSYRSFVFYGRSGTGKTTLACTFPGKILLCDVKDQGTDSVADLDDTVDVMSINSWDDFETTYWWLKQNQYYDNIVIDTVSQLQQLCIEYVLEEKNKDTENAGDWGTMTKREWGDVASLMKIWILRFRDLTANIVFIAQDRVFNLHDDEVDPEAMLEPEVGPRLTPAIAAHLNAAVSVIGNTYIRMRIEKKEVRIKVKGKRKPKIKTKEIEVPEYCLRIGPNPVYITKVRKPRDIIAPSTIVDPNYEEILEIIKGE
jgi:phage nucleotide-binding protein